jgi:hypothetical protein
MTIKEFVVKFKQIKKMGFIPTKRNGATGIRIYFGNTTWHN